jgi:NAD+ diphosphatase
MAFVPGIEPPAHDPAAPASAVHFVVHPKGLIVRRVDGAPRLLDREESRMVGATGAEPHFLGQLDGVDAFALAARDGVEVAEPFELIGLRALHGAASDLVFSVAGRAVQLVDWASTHRFCGRCATPTERIPSERALRCPACGLVAYPRIAPAIIVLIRDGDRALLARGARFPTATYSTLAGFVEAGESVEETLLREVKEEVGVDVGGLRYFGSQSWPFPNSLMLGFFATYEGGEIVCQPSEIVDANWFTIDELPMIPPPLSISRKLIDAWVEDVRKTRTSARVP